MCLPGTDPDLVTARLTELVEHSVLEVVTSATPVRYRMLAVVRRHAVTTAGAGTVEEVEAALQTHLTGVFAAAADASTTFTPGDVAALAAVHDDAVAALDRALADGRAHGVVGLLLGLVRYWRVTGRLRFAVDRLAAARSQVQGPPAAVLLVVQGDLERVLGRLDDAHRHTRAGLDLMVAAGPALAHAVPYADGVLGMILSDQGHHQQARDVYHGIAATHPLPTDSPLRALWCSGLGSIETRARHDDVARDLLEEARQHFARRPVWLQGRVLGDLGTLARRRGENAEALRLTLEGLERLAEYGALAEAAPFVDEVAEILDDSGRPQDAATCRTAAADLRRRVGAAVAPDPAAEAPDGYEIGDVVTLARCEPPAPEPAARPGSVLTPRELEVAGLVAEGLTNPQIAARLVISPGTARTHVERIRTKLGVPSRVHVARWVLQKYVDRRIP
ncbi:response regulator transcription factor [Isoptericola jiangsuensis]|uniref:response regulator transcription factor n=1 Tax=Isoptericola jiangsuensis TaxID=548579 RepID=UPI003AAFAA9A